MATTTGKLTDGVWGPKHYILTAIAVTLAVSAVAVVTSVILSPARLVFSVTATSTNQLQGAPVLILNFTMDAANPSRRAGVEYGSLTARLRVDNASHGADASVQTVVHPAMPLLQPPASWRLEQLPCLGLLRPALLVRFKVGLAYSRPYDVEVSCQPVDFFTAAAAGTKVGCVA
ncbi:hypothetical protein TRIUR3_18256 [Triticum urartu]|uniref:Late embryogenesis abundant protein LEA-2 subgroup domain-containing protein n=1 Tax=Triticum urartu TaxID=4572 RepID=M8A9F2_TRIUA|nr:hypothetical protein TRIUR3_18256 [Triticum urartu]